jgi:hypothetical protein
LAEALAGAQVVDLKTHSFEDAAVEFLRRRRNLLAAEAAAGVSHHVASIVWHDRLIAAIPREVGTERLIKASDFTRFCAHAVLRAMSRAADSFSDGKTIRVPPASYSRILSDDVVAGWRSRARQASQ